MLLGDLRYAARGLRKAPIFTAVAMLTLGLGIGVNTSMFSVLNAELLRSLPFRDPTRLVRVAERNDKLHRLTGPHRFSITCRGRKSKRCFEQLGAIGNTSFALQFVGNTLTPGLLALLGIRPIQRAGFRRIALRVSIRRMFCEVNNRPCLRLRTLSPSRPPKDCPAVP